MNKVIITKDMLLKIAKKDMRNTFALFVGLLIMGGVTVLTALFAQDLWAIFPILLGSGIIVIAFYMKGKKGSDSYTAMTHDQYTILLLPVIEKEVDESGDVNTYFLWFPGGLRHVVSDHTFRHSPIGMPHYVVLLHEHNRVLCIFPAYNAVLADDVKSHFKSAEAPTAEQ